MNKLIYLFAVTMIIATSTFCQTQNLYFDDTTYKQSIIIDKILNPNNIWQIGKPQKNIFTSAYSIPNAIVTDTLNSYPNNDSSKFIIRHKVQHPGSYCGTSIFAYYKVNTDTLNDFGKIEFSFNKGYTWMNILTDTNLIEHDFPYTAPVFSGNSYVWKSIHFRVHSIYNTQTGDTVLFRFTFFSDNIQTNKDGLMFDNIQIDDCGEGIEELSYDFINSKIFPNPVNNNVLIEFDNKNNSSFEITLLNNSGKVVRNITDIRQSTVNINIQELSSGIYFYKLISKIDKKNSFGKFIKQ